MVETRKNVALVRDMTDTMYNPTDRPATATSTGPTALSNTSNGSGAQLLSTDLPATRIPI